MLKASRSTVIQEGAATMALRLDLSVAATGAPHTAALRLIFQGQSKMRPVRISPFSPRPATVDLSESGSDVDSSTSGNDA